jgi:hypothetical protein
MKNLTDATHRKFLSLILAFKETNDITAAQRESKLTATQAEDLKFAGLITGKMYYNNQNKPRFVIWGIN